MEGSSYTLMLDDNGFPITGWTIDWDDGNVEPITGNPSTVDHLYADGGDNCTITATATDGADTYSLPTTGVRSGMLDPTFGTGGLVESSLPSSTVSDTTFIQVQRRWEVMAFPVVEASLLVETAFALVGDVRDRCASMRATEDRRDPLADLLDRDRRCPFFPRSDSTTKNQ